MIKIPKLVYDDVEPKAFVKECSKLLPPSPPKFQLHDLVQVPANFGRETPGMISGYESRQGDRWTYHVIRPRDYDGGLERVTVSEDQIKKL